MYDFYYSRALFAIVIQYDEYTGSNHEDRAVVDIRVAGLRSLS